MYRPERGDLAGDVQAGCSGRLERETVAVCGISKDVGSPNHNALYPPDNIFLREQTDLNHISCLLGPPHLVTA
jgi:hypothetical protein